MGDAADDAFDAWWRVYDATPDVELRRFEWMDADGTVHDMHDMNNTHLGNCLRLCEQACDFMKATEIMTIIMDRVGVFP